MSEVFTRRGDDIIVDLNQKIRKFLHGLAEAILLGTRDGTHPFAHRLTQPITVTKDEDDPVLVLARHDVIATSAQVLEATAWSTTLRLDEAESWFETLQVGSQVLAGSFHVAIESDLDRLDPDDRERLRIIQGLLGLLVEVLDEVAQAARECHCMRLEWCPGRRALSSSPAATKERCRGTRLADYPIRLDLDLLAREEASQGAMDRAVTRVPGDTGRHTVQLAVPSSCSCSTPSSR